MFLMGSKQAELIVSRLEQDEYYSLLKEIILLFANIQSPYQRYYFVTFCSKNVACLLGVA
jgi:hypothetical protein